MLVKNSDPVKTDWSLTEIQSYVVEAFILVLLQSTTANKMILNIHKIIRGYSAMQTKILQVKVKKNEVFSSFYVHF